MKFNQTNKNSGDVNNIFLDRRVITMHDCNGTQLKVGDVVHIPCVITQISEDTPDYCNVSVETIHGRRPDEKKEKMSAINTKVLLLVSRK
jgi:hypothetical protein